MDEDSCKKQLSKEQQEAFDAIVRGESVLLTGPGGTGKSFLIGILAEKIPELTGKPVAITALTGCAALLIGHGAKTLHSWAGIGLGKGSAEYHAQNIRKMPQLAMRWRKTGVLIIDEVSMLTPELLELIDGIAKILRRNSSPMGGIQMVFVGDFYQLPPVSKDGPPKFVFESSLWPALVKRTIELKRIFRQADPTFHKILDEARIGDISKESLQLLKAREDLDYSNESIKPTILFTRKVDVEVMNRTHLDELKGVAHTFVAKTLPSEYPVQEITRTVERLDKDATYMSNLILKEGAQVMLLINLDQDKGLVNGSRGVVTGFKDDVTRWPIVEFKNGEKLVIEPHVWESEHIPPIQRQQIPLRLAYALTIHKAQGATLDCALIDIGPSTFEYGQAYVALSRVRSLSGLYVFDVEPSAFRAHPLVKEFYKGNYKPKESQVQKNEFVEPVSVKRKTPPKQSLSGKKANYAFDDDDNDEKPVPKKEQPSLKAFWGVPK